MSEVSKNTPTLVALAAHIAREFPELNGRSIAVSEVEPFRDKTNVPPLPMALVALVGEQNDASGRGGASTININDDVLLQFMFEPVKYSTASGADTPFFAFYDYEALRDRLLQTLRDWRTPRNHSVSFNTLAVESDELAVYIAMRLTIKGTVCSGATDAIQFTIDTNISQPRGLCEPCDTLPAECDLTPVCDPPAAHKQED